MQYLYSGNAQKQNYMDVVRAMKTEININAIISIVPGLQKSDFYICNSLCIRHDCNIDCLVYRQCIHRK